MGDTARMPGRCRACGARVELSIGEHVPAEGRNQFGAWSSSTIVRSKLPTAWCEPGTGTTIPHACP